MKEQVLVQRFIKSKKKRVAGGAHMYILTLFMILYLLVFFKTIYDRQRIYITYDTIDDAIATSLTASCKYNPTEYGISGQAVIYRTITPVKIPDLFDELMGITPSEDTEYNPLTDSEILLPGSDSELNTCYTKFLTALKHYMNLDDSMNTTLGGIKNPVQIKEFSVFNKYEERDEEGNILNYMFVKYTRTASGTWEATSYPENTNPSIYNGFDKTTDTITDTSVVANIGINLRLADVNAFTQDKTEDDLCKAVSYQRIVSIKRK